MMNVLPSGSVSISKGDTGGLTIRFESDVSLDGAEVLVTLKKHKNDKCPLWEKRVSVEDSSIFISLESSDTSFPPGQYFWDVRLVREGEVITPVTPRTFTILEVVGNV